MKHAVVIVEDHQLFRDGLKSMLGKRDDVVVVGEAEDGLTALKLIRKLKPDLILLDLSMPKMGGISVLKDVKRELPDTCVLLLTIYESDQYVLEAFEAGADGYCIKDSSREELMMAIDSVLDGKTYISPGISDQVMEGFLSNRRRLKKKNRWDTITQREREVLKLLAEGYSNKEIGDLLHISVKTVETYKARVMEKLNLRSRAALVRFALKHGLLDEEKP